MLFKVYMQGNLKVYINPVAGVSTELHRFQEIGSFAGALTFTPKLLRIIYFP